MPKTLNILDIQKIPLGCSCISRTIFNIKSLIRNKKVGNSSKNNKNPHMDVYLKLGGYSIRIAVLNKFTELG